MRTRLHHVWDRLTSSYWFIPALMLAGSVGLAAGMLLIDRRVIPPPSNGGPWLYGGGAEGARTLLSVVAGSIITVAGVVFSITTATLTQASSQFGPRLLRNFMRDTGNQAVLGTFVATFLYCLLILRAVPAGASAAVPHLSVTVAVALAVTSLCVLVYFIHHVSASLQAPNVVATAWEDVDDALRRLFPEALGRGGPAPPLGSPDAALLDRPPVELAAARSGYVQAVDEDALMGAVAGHDACLRLLARPGKFVAAGSPVALAWLRPTDVGGTARAADADPAAQGDRAAALAAAVNASLIIGRNRTPEQDVEFTLGQIAEIAVRALSPGINDPYTAATCVDWLGEALCQVARADEHSPFRYDDGGALRVITDVSTFPGIVDAAFDQVRQYGRTSAAVTIRLLEVIAAVAGHARSDAQRQALRRQADMILRQSREGLPEAEDRADVETRHRHALRALAVSDKPSPSAAGGRDPAPDPSAGGGNGAHPAPGDATHRPAEVGLGV